MQVHLERQQSGISDHALSYAVAGREQYDTKTSRRSLELAPKDRFKRPEAQRKFHP